MTGRYYSFESGQEVDNARGGAGRAGVLNRGKGRNERRE